MTTNEALEVLDGVIHQEAQVGLAHRKGPSAAIPIMDSWSEALAVLRAVCEDYERARPLLSKVDEIFRARLYGTSEDVRLAVDALQAALAYREAKEKP
jgi:hypothetical protein